MASAETTATSANVEPQQTSDTPIELSSMSNQVPETAASPNTLGTKTPTGAFSHDEEAMQHPDAGNSPISAQTAPSLPAIQSHNTSFASAVETRTEAPPLTRELTTPAIGPATDKPVPVPKEDEDEGPILYITLLLTTGARHPFKLDRKYLRKRGVEVEEDNPVNMSLYKLKELILRDWREEWEAKPSSPDSIRLISMGKLLTDKSKLSDFGFKDGASPTIVHMTIKPQDIVDEEDANKNIRDHETNTRTPRCRCTIM